MYFSSKNSIKLQIKIKFSNSTCIFHKLKSTISTRFVNWTADFQHKGWQTICLSAKKRNKFLVFDIYRCFAATTGVSPEEPNEQAGMCSMCVTKPLREKFWFSHQPAESCHVSDQIKGSTRLICTTFIWSTALLRFSGSSEQSGKCDLIVWNYV